MKRFFFDIDRSGLRTEDQTGTILSDAAAASQELLTAVLETASTALRGAENGFITGSVREEGCEAFFECRIELRSKWRS